MVRAHRWLVWSVAVAGTPFFLAACGGGGSSTGETTPGQSTTAWRTIPPINGSDTGSSVLVGGANITYTVKARDYYGKIAQKAGGSCTGQDLQDYNPKHTDLFPGDQIKIPTSCLGANVTEDSLNADGATTDTTAATDATGSTDSTDSADTTDTTDAPKYNTYVVVAGDYEFGIVKKTGCSSKELRKANPGKMVNLHPKLKLKVPVSCDTRSKADLTDDTNT